MRIGNRNISESINLPESNSNKLKKATSNLKEIKASQFNQIMSGMKEGTSEIGSKTSAAMENIIAKIRGLPTPEIFKIAVVFIVSKFGISQSSSKDNAKVTKLVGEFSKKLSEANKNLGLNEVEITNISSTVGRLVQEKRELWKSREEDAVIHEGNLSIIYSKERDSVFVQLKELGSGTNKIVYNAINFDTGKGCAVSKRVASEVSKEQFQNTENYNKLLTPFLQVVTENINGEKTLHQFSELKQREWGEGTL